MQQMQLLEVVQAKHPLLGQCYEGALRALGDQRNPDGLAQAAHSARELFDYLPLAVTTEMPKKPSDLTPMVRSLIEEWQKAITRTANITEQGWAGEIDDHLRRVLQRITDFVRWFDVEHPRHGIEQDMILDQFDPANRPLPKQLRDRRGRMVRDLQRYMNKVAHHNSTPTRAEFLERFSGVEAILRELMRPEPLADRKLMDEILRGSQ
jgi:hypothetical protein